MAAAGGAVGAPAAAAPGAQVMDVTAVAAPLAPGQQAAHHAVTHGAPRGRNAATLAPPRTPLSATDCRIKLTQGAGRV